MTIRVLVVDDEQMVGEAVAAIISRRLDESVVTLAGSLESALGYSAGDFDVVITDYELSKANRKITSVPVIERFHDTAKVILITSNWMSESEWQSFGAHGFMQKPMTSEKLLQMIRDLLDAK